MLCEKLHQLTIKWMQNVQYCKGIREQMRIIDPGQISQVLWLLHRPNLDQLKLNV